MNDARLVEIRRFTKHGWMAPQEGVMLIECLDEIDRLRAELARLTPAPGPCSAQGGCDCAPDNDTPEPLHLCSDCGRPLQEVRPGKWQCDGCEEYDADEHENGLYRSQINAALRNIDTAGMTEAG